MNTKQRSTAAALLTLIVMLVTCAWGCRSSYDEGSAASESAVGADVTIGETNILPDYDDGNANLLVAQQASLGQAATLQSLSFYVTNAAGSLRLGVYDAT